MSQRYSEVVLAPEELQAIGAVAVESGELEGILGYYIRIVSGLSKSDAALLISRTPLEARADLLRDLVRARLQDKAALHEWEALCVKAKAAIANRNIIIHGQWYARRLRTLRGTNTWVREGEAKAQPRRNKKSPPLPATEVIKTAEGLSKITRAVAAFVSQHIVQPALERRAHARRALPASPPPGRA